MVYGRLVGHEKNASATCVLPVRLASTNYEPIATQISCIEGWDPRSSLNGSFPISRAVQSGLSFLEIAQAPASDTSAGSEAETMHRDTLPSRPHPSVRWRANTGHWPTQSRLISAAPKTSGIKWMQEFSRTRLSVLRGLCDPRNYQVTHRYNPQI